MSLKSDQMELDFSIFDQINVGGGGDKKSLMPRLHLPYDEYTMPIRCPITISVRPPQRDLAIIVGIYRHRGLYDFV